MVYKFNNMKKILLFTMFLTTSFGFLYSSDDAKQAKEKVYLTNTKLTSEEQSIIDNFKETKFIGYIFPKDITDDKLVLYYKLDNPYHELLPKLLLYLYKDKDVYKLHSVKNNIAILVNKDFDITLFEQNAKNVNVRLIPILKQDFIND